MSKKRVFTTEEERRAKEIAAWDAQAAMYEDSWTLLMNGVIANLYDRKGDRLRERMTANEALIDQWRSLAPTGEYAENQGIKRLLNCFQPDKLAGSIRLGGLR